MGAPVMRIVADRERCEGHGQCSVIDLDLFPLDDDGHTAIDGPQPVPDGEQDIALIGVAACPARALAVQDD